MANVVKIKVNGVDIETDLDEDLVINDVGEEQRDIASKMGYWGALAAAADSEKIKTDAYYRAWRAKIGTSILLKDPKSAEWKVKQKIEAHEDFEKLKAAIAMAAHNVTLCRNNFESFKTKAAQLQSKGAMMRSELDATGMTTKEKRPPKTAKAKRKKKEKESEKTEKTKHMKNVFGK